jgi:hypothetical protein
MFRSIHHNYPCLTVVYVRGKKSLLSADLTSPATVIMEESSDMSALPNPASLIVDIKHSSLSLVVHALPF